MKLVDFTARNNVSNPQPRQLDPILDSVSMTMTNSLSSSSPFQPKQMESSLDSVSMTLTMPMTNSLSSSSSFQPKQMESSLDSANNNHFNPSHHDSLDIFYKSKV